MKNDDLAFAMLVYLTGTAPDEIPVWFKAKGLPEAPPSVPNYRDYYEGDQAHELCRSWIEDPICDLPEPLNRFQRDYQTAMNAREAHKERERENRYFEWRVYYGSQVLKRTFEATE